MLRQILQRTKHRRTILEQSHTRVFPLSTIQRLNLRAHVRSNVICRNLAAVAGAFSLHHKLIDKSPSLRLAKKTTTIFATIMQHDLGVLFKYRYKYLSKTTKEETKQPSLEVQSIGVYCQNRDNYKMAVIIRERPTIFLLNGSRLHENDNEYSVESSSAK